MQAAPQRLHNWPTSPEPFHQCASSRSNAPSMNSCLAARGGSECATVRPEADAEQLHGAGTLRRARRGAGDLALLVGEVDRPCMKARRALRGTSTCIRTGHWLGLDGPRFRAPVFASCDTSATAGSRAWCSSRLEPSLYVSDRLRIPERPTKCIDPPLGKASASAYEDDVACDSGRHEVLKLPPRSKSVWRRWSADQEPRQPT